MEQNNQMNYDSQQHHQQSPQPPHQPQPQMRPPIISGTRRTKNKFFTFMTALIPGGGQMYHGLLKKGLSIMAIFWGIIAIAVLLYIPVICFLLPIVWFYSFFDAVNRMNMPIDEMKMIKDEYLYQVNISHGKTISNILKKRHVWIGWGLTLIGIYSTFRMTMDMSYGLISQYIDDSFYWSIRHFMNTIPTLIVPIVCVVIGIKLIKGANKKQQHPTTYIDNTPREEN
ncbi:MAG: hypothetical protein RR444_02270 [Oscillospiraceae bacterium]